MSSASSPDAPLAPVKRWRRRLVWVVAAVLVLGHGYDIAAQTEHWPFSFYPMYGRVQKKARLQLLSAYGLVQDGKHTRQMRIVSGEFVPPLSEARLRNILMAAWGRDGTAHNAEKDTAAILHDYLLMYESRRVAGLHDGPPMIEAQLCQITWVVRNDIAAQKPRSVDVLIGVRANGRIIHYSKTTTKPDEADGKDDVEHD